MDKQRTPTYSRRAQEMIMALDFAKKAPKKKKPFPIGKKAKSKLPPKVGDSEDTPVDGVDEEAEDSGPPNNNIFKRWARGAKKDAVRPDEDLPSSIDASIEDKLIDKIGEMRPGDDDLALDDDFDMDGDLLSADNRCWAGECGVMDMVEGDADALLSYLDSNEPAIYQAVMDLATAVSDADADAVTSAKQALMEVEQEDPVYPEFDDAQREKAASNIVEYISEAGYPEVGSPELVEAVAHALVEARGGDSMGEDIDDEDLDLPEDELPLDEEGL